MVCFLLICTCFIFFSLHFFLFFSYQKTKEDGKHIILLGEKGKDEEMVFRYFLPLENKHNLGDGVIQNSKKYFGLFKLTVTSITSIDDLSEKEKGKDILDKLHESTLLIFCPSTAEQFTFESITDFQTLKKRSQGCYIVLTKCNCLCDYSNCRCGYGKCTIRDDVSQNGTRKPILIRTDGKMFQYRMFFMKLPTELILEISKQIPTTGRLIVEHAPLIFFKSIYVVRRAGQFVQAVINLRRNGSSFVIKHCYI